MIDYNQTGAFDLNSMGFGQNSTSSSSLGESMQNELGLTMRSVRDTLAMSFQTLNLTLSSMNRTLTNLSSNITPKSFMGMNHTFIPAQQVMSHTGTISAPMANFMGHSSTWDLLTQPKPYNVSSYEYAYQRQQELQNRFMGLGVGATTGIGGAIASTALAGPLTSMMTSGIGRAMPFMKGPMAALGAARLGGLPLGSLAMGIPGFALANAVVQPFVGAVQDHAETYMRDTAGIQRMSTRFSDEFTRKQSAGVAKGMYGLSNVENRNATSLDTNLGMDGYRNILMQGLQANLFHGTSPEQLVKQLGQAGQVVKLLTGILGSKDINETMQALVQFKGMGVNLVQNQGYAQKLGNSAFKYGSTMGIPGAELLQNAMAQGSGIYSGMGMAGFGGVLPMMRNMALVHEMEKRNSLTASEMSVGGGQMGIAGAMTQAVGGMMKNPAIGDVMLASSMQNGHFSKGAFDRSAQKGYFGMVGQGASNFSDINQLFSFYANKTNMQSELFENGGGDDTILQVARKALENMPYYKNAKGKNKLNMATVYIKKIASDMSGQDISDAAAKALATRLVHPNMMNHVDGEANRMAQRGLDADMQQHFGIGRSFGRIADDFAKIPGQFSAAVIQPLGNGLTDYFRDKIEGRGPDQYADYAPGTGSKNSIKMYFDSLRQVRDLGSIPGMRESNNAADTNAAYEAGDNVFGTYGGKMTSTYYGAGFGGIGLGNATNSMKSRAAMEQMGMFKEYYGDVNNIKSGNGMTGVEAYGMIKGNLGNMSYYNALQKYKKNIQSRTGFGSGQDAQIAPGKIAMHDMLNEYDPHYYQNQYDQFIQTDKFKNFSSAFNGGGMSASIEQALGLDQGALQNTDSNAIYTKILDKNTNVDDIASRYGFSGRRDLAAGVVAAQGRGLTGSWTDEMFQNQGEYNRKRAGEAAFGADGGMDSNSGNFENYIQNGKTDGLNGIDMGGLKELGINDDLLSKIMDAGGSGVEDIGKLGRAAGSLAYGESNSEQYMSGVQNTDVRKAYDELAKKDPKELAKIMQRIGGKSGMMFGDLGEASAQAALKHKVVSGIQDQYSTLFGASTGKSVYKDLFGGNEERAYDTIANLKSDDSQVQDVQSRLQSLRDIQTKYGTGDEAVRQVANMGVDGFDYDKIKGKSFKETERDMIAQATASDADIETKLNKEKERGDKDIRDALIKVGNGMALRVTVASSDDGKDPAKDGRTKTTSDTITPSSNIDPTDTNGNSPQTPGSTQQLSTTTGGADTSTGFSNWAKGAPSSPGWY